MKYCIHTFQINPVREFNQRAHVELRELQGEYQLSVVFINITHQPIKVRHKKPILNDAVFLKFG
ncbi:MAG: hypothetical protein BA863_11965 [Desulfovibrio sp. S3730MH75]|nr:MAG: hypothetical protein BA863_11965 [Desulfovibrio sp. S3730MH75]